MSERPKTDERLKSVQDKLRADRENRKAEQLTPEKRQELMESEQARRAIADEEARKQKESQWWRDEQELQKGKELDAGMHEALAKPAFIVNKMQEENQALEKIHVAKEVNRSPEEEVKETSKELMPDVRQESSGQNEQMDEEKEAFEKKKAEAVNDVSESVASIRRELQNTESFEITRGAFNRLEELLPQRSRRFQELEEISSQVRSFQVQFEELDGVCARLASSVEGADMQDVIREAENLQAQLEELKGRARAYQEDIEVWATTLGRWAGDSEDLMGYDTADEIRSMTRRVMEAAEEAHLQAKRASSRLEEPLEELQRIAKQ